MKCRRVGRVDNVMSVVARIDAIDTRYRGPCTSFAIWQQFKNSSWMAEIGDSTGPVRMMTTARPSGQEGAQARRESELSKAEMPW